MARGDRAALDSYLAHFRVSAAEFFSLSEGEQRARLGLDSRDKLIEPTADEAKAAAEFKAKRDADRKAAEAKKAAEPKTA